MRKNSGLMNEFRCKMMAPRIRANIRAITSAERVGKGRWSDEMPAPDIR